MKLSEIRGLSPLFRVTSQRSRINVQRMTVYAVRHAAHFSLQFNQHPIRNLAGVLFKSSQSLLKRIWL